MANVTIKNLIEQVENMKTHSAWERGVKAYALELLDEVREGIDGGYFYEDDLNAPRVLHKMLLNGASDWKQFSWGGCGLIYNGDIAKRLCAPYEMRLTRNGEKKPNRREEWLDTQARALFQAEGMINEAVRQIRERIECGFQKKYKKLTALEKNARGAWVAWYWDNDTLEHVQIYGSKRYAIFRLRNIYKIIVPNNVIKNV